MNNLTEMLKGILEGCVLEIINRKETYGYEITRILNKLGFSNIAEATVYTILVRFGKNQLVEINKKPSEKGPPRKFYALNDSGSKKLYLLWEKRGYLTSKINELRENELLGLN